MYTKMILLVPMVYHNMVVYDVLKVGILYFSFTKWMAILRKKFNDIQFFNIHFVKKYLNITT